MRGLAVALCLSTTPSAAQEYLSPDAFLDFAEGKTLTFRNYEFGVDVGVEEYLSRELSVWRDESGRCVYGRITTTNGQLCFYYDGDTDGPACWWPFRKGERLFVRLARFGAGEIQEVVAVTEETLSCPTVPAV